MGDHGNRGGRRWRLQGGLGMVESYHRLLDVEIILGPGCCSVRAVRSNLAASPQIRCND